MTVEFHSFCEELAEAIFNRSLLGRFGGAAGRGFSIIFVRATRWRERLNREVNAMKKILATACALTILALPGTGADRKDVSFKAADGLALKATYFSPGRPGPAILLLHQCNLERNGWNNLGARLADAGFHVLFFDYRSYGQRAKWGPDMEAALDWLGSQAGVNKEVVGVAGASCGVYFALLLAQHHPQVKTLVLLSGPADDAGKTFVQDSQALPILGAASEEDSPSFENIKALVALSKNPTSKFLAFQGAGHGAKMFGKEKDLEPTIVDWFRARLMPGK